MLRPQTIPGRGSDVPRHQFSVVGLVGCVLLAVNLPWTSMAAGAAVLAAGAAIRAVRRPR